MNKLLFYRYVITERCYGDFFGRYNAKLGLAPREVSCAVVFQMFAGLQHMHRLLCIHRDIKPENILFKTPPVPAALLDDYVDQ